MGNRRDIPLTNEALAASTDAPSQARVLITSPGGERVTVHPSQLGPFLTDGWQVVSDLATEDLLREQKYGSQTGRTILEAGLRGASLGLYDIFATKVLGESGFEMEQRVQQHPVLAPTVEMIGAIGPALIPGGQFTAAGALSRGAARVARMGAGRGTAARLGAGALAGGLEGATMSAGLGFGAAMRRGEEVSTAASQAMRDGLLGGAIGGAAGFAFTGGEMALRRVFKGRAQQAAAEAGGLGQQVKAEYSRIRDVMKARADNALELENAEAIARGYRMDLDEALGAVPAAQTVPGGARRRPGSQTVVSGPPEGMATQAGRETATKALEREYQQILAGYKPMKQELRNAGAEMLLAKRSGADRVGVIADVALQYGPMVGQPGLQKAGREFLDALDQFDATFGTKAADGKALLEWDPASLVNVLEADFSTAIKVTQGLQRKADDLVKAYEGMGAKVFSEQSVRRSLDELMDRDLGDLLASVAAKFDEVRGAKAAKAARSAEIQAEKRLVRQVEADEAKRIKQEAADEIKARKEAEAAAAKQKQESAKRVQAAEADLEKAQERINKLRASARDMDEVIAMEPELKPLIDEIEPILAKDGVKFSKEDMALAAMELGIDYTDILPEEVHWLLRAHMVSKLMTGNGLIARDGLGGVAGGLITSAVGGVGRGVAAKVMGAVGLQNEMLRYGALAAGGRGGREIAGAVLKKGQKAAYVSPAVARAEFERRVTRSLKRLTQPVRAARKVAPAATAVALSKMRFSDMEHKGDGALPDLDRHFERRAAELDQVMEDPAAAAERIGSRLVSRGLVAPEDVDEVVGSIIGSLQWLHGKLPPPRPAGPFDGRRNASRQEMRRWAEQARYVTDPAAVAEDLASQTLTAEGVRAVREVAPMVYAGMQGKVIDYFTDHQDAPRAVREYVSLTMELPLARSFSSAAAMAAQASAAASRTLAETAPTAPAGGGRLNSTKPTTAERLQR